MAVKTDLRMFTTLTPEGRRCQRGLELLGQGNKNNVQMNSEIERQLESFKQHYFILAQNLG